MTRGPTVAVGTCLRCGGDTAHGRGDGVRHRIQLVDAPAGRGGAALRGQLCPACWTATRRFLRGAEPEETTAPTMPEPPQG